MVKVKAWLIIVRPINLLFIGLALVLVRYGLLLPAYASMSAPTQLTSLDFALLVISTCSITAAGYLTNDCFDRETDRLNRPNRPLANGVLTVEAVRSAAASMNALGVGLAAWVAFTVDLAPLVLIQLSTVFLLYAYARWLKCWPVIGNLLVSGSIALVIWLPALFDPTFMDLDFGAEPASRAMRYLFGFSAFAFLTNWLREIAKDLEDQPGDRATACRTLPVAVGQRRAKQWLLLLLAVTLMLWPWLLWKIAAVGAAFGLWAIGALIAGLFVLIGWQTLRADRAEDFSTVSRLLKLVMLVGLLSMMFCRYP